LQGEIDKGGKLDNEKMKFLSNNNNEQVNAIISHANFEMKKEEHMMRKRKKRNPS